MDMDMTTCVARRTRSRVESHLVSRLNESKGIPVKDPPEESLDSRKTKKRTSMRNACSTSPVRSRRKANEDDDVKFIASTIPEGKPEEGVNVGSDSVISPRLESNSLDSDMVCDFAVDNANSKGQEKTPPSVSDDDVVIVETIPREEEHVEDCNVDKVCDSPVDAVDFNGQEKSPTSSTVIPEADDVMSISTSDDVISLNTSDDEDEDADYDEDEDADNESSDDGEENSDSTYVESSESEFDRSDCSDDEVGTRDAAKRRKSSSEKVYTSERRKTLLKENNSDVCELLAKSIWESTKISEEDICSGDEAPEVDLREDAIVRERSSEKVHEQRKPRSSRRVKEKKNSNVFDLLESDLCWKGGSFNDDGAEGPPPLNLRFGCEEEEPEPIEKTEEEEEIDTLWEDMAFALKSEDLHSSTTAKKGDVPCIKGEHDFILDEEIGLKCRHCSYVSVEIKDISPAMEPYRVNVSDKNKCSDRKGDPLPSGLDFEASDHSNYVTSLNNTEGTVWQYIPGVKDTLYQHQQEGFEFIWKNLAGATKLDGLESLEEKESGGCIISHSPGTGKTRLTIVFLQSYLERFPDSHPVVIAPASLLFTWEEEFRKWNANIPFYNMGSLEFSGLEDPSAVSLLKGNKGDKRSIRMVKLYSWRKKKSILGVSYHLFEKLAKNKDAGEMQEFRRMLLELPGLLVLDEGHTPRNQNSCIWKVISEVRTEKRIILSGTPFQNNFKELSNVLCLARPAYTDSISSRLQDLSKRSGERNNGMSNEEIGIVELRAMIAPFVHVYKGLILRESLPGLRDCVVVLNPPFVQKKLLDRIDSQNTFELEHKLSAVSVHPSLYLDCNPTKTEEILIGPVFLKTLESLRHNSKEGVKMRFLIDFIRFSETVKEKVLVFSQYIDTLKLIMEHLSAVFGWEEGKEILFMHGQLDQRVRQHLINNFNKSDSESKVLLASTKASSEGISLVGASRVILLDVVWNPSVESQAISRAYRIGQKRVVYTYHLMVKGTSEWEKYCKQTKKHHISELVFSSTNEKDAVINKEVVSEDRILDEMVRHEKLKDMFEKILYHPKESDMSTNIL
ncbi:hypothetical protein AALP_AA3G281500 [Arabis alpina]|uniref:SNF2 domain-containing protein CLASSY 4-like n=1 Tax=Arabis alpina TaxID=50452 RepID=A0A087HC86_ARAAL|nr:hypothetical protein AALP_AA3G281500 [Arabis alpina]